MEKVVLIMLVGIGPLQVIKFRKYAADSSIRGGGKWSKHSMHTSARGTRCSAPTLILASDDPPAAPVTAKK